MGLLSSHAGWLLSFWTLVVTNCTTIFQLSLERHVCLDVLWPFPWSDLQSLFIFWTNRHVYNLTSLTFFLSHCWLMSVDCSCFCFEVILLLDVVEGVLNFSLYFREFCEQLLCHTGVCVCVCVSICICIYRCVSCPLYGCINMILQMKVFTEK